LSSPWQIDGDRGKTVSFAMDRVPSAENDCK
jgi:hypothetical protein